MYKYNKTTWKNKEQDPKGGTPLSAANFNNIEEGIEQAHIKADIIETTGLGYKALFDDGVYKFPPEGSGDVLTTGSDDYVCFTATEDTSTFTIQTTSDSTVTLLKENLEMVKDVDYTINKGTGVVSLNFVLKKNEKIYYKIEEHISVDDMATVSDLYKHAESSEPHKNVIGTDTLTTSAKTVKEAINEVNNETINKIIISDSKPENMVKNTFYLQNSDVVHDGLIYAKNSVLMNKIPIPNISESKYYVHMSIIKPKTEALSYLLKLNEHNVGIQFNENGKLHLVNTENGRVLASTNLYYSLNDNVDLILLKDGDYYELRTPKETIFATNDRDKNVGASSLLSSNYCYIYNRTLSQEEIKYNFHALGEDKVATIEDANGREYAFSAKSQNVFMKNGSNLDAALNQFIAWKELTMNSDGTFPLIKCADWHSDKLHIEGQTVKNLQSRNISNNITLIKSTSRTHIANNLYSNLKQNTQYTIFWDILNVENFTDKFAYLAIEGSSGGRYFTATIKNIGVGSGTFITPQNVSESAKLYLYIDSLEVDNATITFLNNFPILEGDLSGMNNLINCSIGLNSLGDKKGNETYISLESNGYENQIEIAEPLRKVGNVADIIDGNVLTRNIKEITKDDISGLKLNNVNYLNVGNFYLTIQPCLTSYGICNILDRQTTLISDTSTSGFLLADSKTLFIRLKDITTVEEAKKWLYDNNFQLQYQLATPHVGQVKSTFVYTPNSSGECNFKYINTIAPSNSKLSVAQTTNQALDEIKTAIISLGGAL